MIRQYGKERQYHYGVESAVYPILRSRGLESLQMTIIRQKKVLKCPINVYLNASKMFCFI